MGIASFVMSKDESKTTIYSILLICFVSFIWAAMEAVIRLIPGEHNLYQVVWVRYATHILFMLLVLGARYRIRLVRTQRLKLQFGRALMMFVMPVSFILAVNYMAPNNIIAIFWLSPLVILGSSTLLLDERPGLASTTAVLLGFVLILILFRPDRQITLPGLVLALAMGSSFGLYLVMTRMLRTEDRVTNLFYTAVGVLIPLSVGLPFFWQPLTLESGLMMASVGLLGFVLLWALDVALEMTRAAILAPFLYTQPLWAIILDVFLRNVLV